MVSVTWLVLALVGLFIILRSLRRPAPPPSRLLQRPALKVVEANPPRLPMNASLDAGSDVPPSPPSDWRAQFASTLYGPGLCSPK